MVRVLQEGDRCFLFTCRESRSAIYPAIFEGSRLFVNVIEKFATRVKMACHVDNVVWMV